MKTKAISIVGLGILLCLGSAYAQEEEITISTYYPAPYGEYEELQTERFVVGSGGNMPNTDGVVNFEGLANDPASGTAGDIYYNNTNNEFMYHNGTNWLPLGTFGGYDMADVTIYTDQRTAGNVTLVNVAGPGVLLGGSVTGFRVNGAVNIVIDGVNFPIPTNICEIEQREENDFSAIPLPGPVRFNNSLSITYTAADAPVTGGSSDSNVVGIAYVMQ